MACFPILSWVTLRKQIPFVETNTVIVLQMKWCNRGFYYLASTKNMHDE